MIRYRTPIRLRPTRLNAKQKIHALLRQDPERSPADLARTVGCTTAYARIWKKNFFAKRPELVETGTSNSTPTA
jgi:hypothetical protein